MFLKNLKNSKLQIFLNTLTINNTSVPLQSTHFLGLNIFYSSQDMIKGSGRAKSHV